jgi:hypothetical protein
VVRTGRGEAWLREAQAAGVVSVRQGAEDPAALALMTRLAVRSRVRWPAGGAYDAPGRLPEVEGSPGVPSGTA